MRRWRSQSEQGGSHDEAKRKQHCWVFFRSNKQRVGNVWSVCEGEEGGVNRLNNRGIISELFHCCLLSSRSLCLGLGVGNKDKTSLSALQPCHGQCVMPNWTHTQSQSGHILYTLEFPQYSRCLACLWSSLLSHNSFIFQAISIFCCFSLVLLSDLSVAENRPTRLQWAGWGFIRWVH